MKRKFSHLCSPITVGRVTFKNRMFSAPMGGTDITMMAASDQNPQHFMN